MRKIFFLLVLCGALVVSGRPEAFVVEIGPGNTVQGILHHYHGLTEQMLREANPGVDFGKYLITGNPLEIPFVPTHELNAAKTRLKEIEDLLAATRKELTALKKRNSELETSNAALALERDALKPVADFVVAYQKNFWRVTALLTIVLIAGGLWVRSLKADRDVERTAKERFMRDVERQKKEILDLRRASPVQSAPAPMRVVSGDSSIRQQLSAARRDLSKK